MKLAEHALTLTPTSARCECRRFHIEGAPTIDEGRARARHAQHVRDEQEDAADRTRAEALFTKDARSRYDRDPKIVKMPGGSSGQAAPRKSRKDGAFPVEYAHVDGFACVMPRGYSRSHAEAERARQDAAPDSGEVVA